MLYIPPEQPDPRRPLAHGEPRYHSLWRPRPAGAYYDEHIAEAAVAFFADYCRFTVGDYAGQPFALQPWQADWIIRPAFGWRRADGRRLYRRIMIWVPRKNGKSELMGGLVHLLMLGDAEPGAECYSIAASEAQARKVFESASNMVAYSRDLADHYEVFEGSLSLRATRGLYMPLTGKAHGKHGLRTTYLIADEVHEWRSSRLYTYVRDAMVSRAEPMEWLISTAGVEAGYGVDLWTESIGLCEGSFDDPASMSVVWCAPPDAAGVDPVDIADERVLREANPNCDVSVSLGDLLAKAIVAKQSPTAENDFRCYHLNQWVGQAERWLPMADWNACTSDPVAPGGQRWQELERELAGRPCFGGLDLASTRDINALVWWFPPQEPNERWKVLCRFFWPRSQLQEAATRSRIPFLSWEKLGAIRTTAGSAADHKAIEAQVVEDCATFQVQGLGIDQFNAHSVATSLNEQGVPVQLVRFAMLSMSGPSKLLERAVLEHAIDHGGHPVLRWMAANVAIRRDRNENYMPSKDDSAAKIDGIAGLVMAIATSGAEDVEAPSYLTVAPLIVL